jgi:hypothetical protein
MKTQMNKNKPLSSICSNIGCWSFKLCNSTLDLILAKKNWFKKILKTETVLKSEIFTSLKLSNFAG